MGYFVFYATIDIHVRNMEASGDKLWDIEDSLTWVGVFWGQGGGGDRQSWAGRRREVEKVRKRKKAEKGWEEGIKGGEKSNNKWQG